MQGRKRLAPTKKQARSAITNGKRILVGIDGRSAMYRRFRDLYHQFLRKTDGRHAELCQQAAALVVQRELLDAAVVRGEPVDTLHLVRLSGVINRTLAQIESASTDAERERKRRRREDREAGLIP